MQELNQMLWMSSQWYEDSNVYGMVKLGNGEACGVRNGV